MKALVYKNVGKLEFTNWQESQKEDYEVKVKVLAAGICGSDLHAFLGHDSRRVPPMVLGHEVFGEVTEGDSKFLGKTVAINPLISCENCDYCREGRENLCPNRDMIGMNKQGGFAEYVNINKKNVLIADTLDPYIGVLCEPLATAVHSINLITKTSLKNIKNCSVLVIGAGSIGLLCAVVLKQNQCKNITVCEKNPLRMENVKTIEGIKGTANLDADEKFDVVIDAVGIALTRTMGMKHIKSGGVFMHIGLGNNEGRLDARKITLDEIFFLGTYAYTHREFKDALNILNDHSMHKEFQWRENRKPEDGQNAFDDIINAKAEAAKIILAF